jgi:hypothetical protein
VSKEGSESNRSREERFAAIEPPKLTLDLSALTGLLLPIKLELPLRKLSEFLSNKPDDPLSLPYRSWKVWLAGWVDGGRGLPLADSQELSSYEVGIDRNCQTKLRGLEQQLQEEIVGATAKMEDVTAGPVSPENSIQQAKNQIREWAKQSSEALEQARAKRSPSRKAADEADASLKGLIQSAGLSSMTPIAPRNWIDKWAELIVLAALDAVANMFMILGKPSLTNPAVIGIPFAVALGNVASGVFVGAHCVPAARRSLRAGDYVAGALLWCVFASITCLVLTSNLLFAQWRESDTARGLPNPLSILAPSYFLFVLGTVVFCFAVAKGQSIFAEPYPEHVEKWGSRQDTRAEAEFWASRCFVLVNQMRDSVRSMTELIRRDVANYQRNAQEARHVINVCVAIAEANLSLLPGVAESVNSSANLFVRRYREGSHARRAKLGVELRYPALPRWELQLDLTHIRQKARISLERIEENLRHLQEFRLRFERDVVPEATQEMERTAAAYKEEGAK